MTLGFTGTQGHLTSQQSFVLEKILKEFRRQGSLDLHHGDCIGADATAHQMWRRLKGRIVLHPPNFASKRAFCDHDEIMPAREYLHRNHDIVDNCFILIACPSTDFTNELLRSGTWATIRYARSIERFTIIIDPQGNVKYENKPVS